MELNSQVQLLQNILSKTKKCRNIIIAYIFEIDNFQSNVNQTEHIFTYSIVINNCYFHSYVHSIYPNELETNDTTDS